MWSMLTLRCRCHALVSPQSCQFGEERSGSGKEGSKREEGRLLSTLSWRAELLVV